MAKDLLKGMGFANVRNTLGGMLAWQELGSMQ
jgi:rhodanese-related sulfurtransferase